MSLNQSATQVEQPLLDVSRALSKLWRRAWIIILLFITSLFVAGTYLALTRPTFTAQSTILFDPRGFQATDFSSASSSVGSDSAAIASQVLVFRSPELLRAVFDELGLASDPEFNRPELVESLLAPLRGPSQLNADMVFQRFLDHLVVEREGLTYAITVSFTSDNAEKAARIVNATVERYISSQVIEGSDTSLEATDLLNERIATLRRDVADAEGAVADFRAQNDTLDSGSDLTLLDNQIEQLNSELLAAQDAAREAEDRHAQAIALGTSPDGLNRLTELLPSNTAEQLRDTYNQRLAELATAELRLGERHPTMIGLRSDIESLGRQMRSEAERIIAELRASAELVQADVDRISDQLADLRAQSLEANQQAAELSRLERNAEASRLVLEQFLARSGETSEPEQLQRPEPRVIARATPPAEPVWPRTTLVLGIAGAFGLLAGSILALGVGGPRRIAQPASSFAPPPLPPVSDAPPASDRPPAAPPTPAPEPAPPAPVTANTPVLAPVLMPGPAVAAGVSEPIADSPAFAPEFAWADQGVLRTRFKPLNPATLSRAQLDAIHLEVAREPRGAFAAAVRALRRNLNLIGSAGSPPMLLLSSVRGGLEKERLAYALAFDCRSTGLTPLIINLEPQSRPPSSPAGQLGPDLTVPESLLETATGLAVIAADPVERGRPRRALDARLVDQAISILGARFDVVFVVGRSLGDPDYSAAVLNAASRQLVVLGDGEDKEGARQIIREQARPNQPPLDLVTIAHGSDPVPESPGAGESYPGRDTNSRRASRYAKLI